MAKDDFHVIVYRILEYLYKLFKKGELVDVDKLNSDALRINDKYFNDIIFELYENGFIKNVEFIDVKDSQYSQAKINKNTKITMKGIEYLSSSEFITKAKKFFNGTLEPVPYLEGI